MRLPEIDEDEVGVGPAGDEFEAVIGKRLRQRGGVVDDLLGVRLELWLEGLLEADSLASDVVHERAALPTGEDRVIDIVGVLLAGHDDPAAPGADGLVCRASDEVGDTDR